MFVYASLYEYHVAQCVFFNNKPTPSKRSLKGDAGGEGPWLDWGRPSRRGVYTYALFKKYISTVGTTFLDVQCDVVM